MRNVHVTLTHFQNESRVLKEINSLLNHKVVTSVIVLAIWKRGLLKRERISDQIEVVRIDMYPIYLANRVFKLSEILRNKWLIKLMGLYLLRFRPKLINIHHVNAIGLVWLKKILVNTTFIYDTHELETETQSSVGQWKKYRKELELRYISKVNHTFVVTPSIAEWYKKVYALKNVTTIMNTPLRHKALNKRDAFREIFEIPYTDTIFIYNGSLFEGRGIEKLLDVFEKIDDKSLHLIFMGDGDLEELIKEYSAKNSNIHFQEAVHPSKVIDFTSSADVGISLIENVCLSYYFCLPNKIFEYTIAEIPMIVSNMKDMSNYVLNNNLGLVIKGESLAEITQAVKNMAVNKKSYKEALITAKEIYNWENEEQKMINVYQNTLGF